MTTQFDEENAAKMETNKFWANVCFMTALVGAIALVQLTGVQSEDKQKTADSTKAAAVKTCVKKNLSNILYQNAHERVMPVRQ